MENLRLIHYCTPIIATIPSAAIQGVEKGIYSRHILTLLEHSSNTASKNHCRYQKANNSIDDFYQTKSSTIHAYLGSIVEQNKNITEINTPKGVHIQ